MSVRFADPSRGLAVGLCLAMALALIVCLASALSGDRVIDLVNGWCALIIAISALYRLCFCRDRSFAGWLLAFIAFDLLALAELSAGRLEMLEHSLHIEDFDDIGLLLGVLVTWLAVSGRENLAVSQRNLLACGFVVQVASTAIDLGDDWLMKARHVTGDDLDLAADLSEFVFLQLYMVGIVGHVFTRAAAGKR